MKHKFYFECITCGRKYSSEEAIYLCPECEKDNDKRIPPKGVLKTLYDYKKIKNNYKRKNLFDNLNKNN